jgi:hypothetical protein
MSIFYKRYQGKIPCLGCGRSGSEYPRPEKDCLCSDCKKHLEKGKFHEKNTEEPIEVCEVRMGNSLIKLMSFDTKKREYTTLLDFGAAIGSFELVEKVGCFKISQNYIFADKMKKYFYANRIDTYQKRTHSGVIIAFNSLEYSKETVLVPLKIVLELVEIVSVFAEIAQKAREHGENEGKSILVQMLKSEDNFYNQISLPNKP